MSFKIFFFCYLLIISQNSVTAAIYYVDNQNGDDNNAGTLQTFPWQSISKVNSHTFEPGDQVLFKKGGIWYETLDIPSGGTAAFPVIYAAYGSGSQPVIDGNNAILHGILSHTKSNVIIREFSVMNTIGSGIRVKHAENVKVEENSVFATGHGGIFIENTSDCTISRNNITTPSGEYDHQTDGIYSQRNSNNVYEGNSIIISNEHPTHHIDGIQCYNDESIIIKNNYIFQNTLKNNSQGIYSTFGSGVNIYFNNVVVCPNSTSSVIGFASVDQEAQLSLYHNTLIGKGANVLNISGPSEFTVKNNIFLALNPIYCIVNLDPDGPLFMDYNLFFNGGEQNLIVYHNVQFSLDEWNAIGFDKNSIEEEPTLESDYSLSPLSPAIDKGIELDAVFQRDKKGTLRPQHEGYDMGAYESSFEVQSAELINPGSFQLYQNYPNPFNPSTRIKFYLTEPSEVLLKVYDIGGNEISTILNEIKSSGEHEVEFHGSAIANGIYFYTIRAKNFQLTKKMILLK